MPALRAAKPPWRDQQVAKRRRLPTAIPAGASRIAPGSACGERRWFPGRDVRRRMAGPGDAGDRSGVRREAPTGSRLDQPAVAQPQQVSRIRATVSENEWKQQVERAVAAEARA